METDTIEAQWATPAVDESVEVEEFLSREGIIGRESIPVSLVLKWPGIVVERSDDNGKTWQRVCTEWERMEAETLVRARPVTFL